MGYSYLPVFGVEPFDNVAKVPVSAFDPLVGADITTFGGGADVTGDNLLVTLWGNIQPGQAPNDPPVGGDLLQPTYTMLEGSDVKATLPGLINNGYSPFAKSRTSFKIALLSSVVPDAPSFITLPLMGILNPPGELKNAYMYAAKATRTAVSANNPTGALVQFKKSILDFLMWRGAFSVSTNIGISQECGIEGTISVGGLFILPLAETSGADGAFPVFYPSLVSLIATGDVAAIQAYLDNIAAGNFYVPLYFQPLVDPGANLWLAEITWPHSVPR